MIDYTNLYIKNLDPDVASYDLFKRFSVYGKIISARVMKDNITTKSKGYGFVSYTHMDEANEALQQMNGAMINNKCIIVTFHEHKKQIPNNNSVKRNSHELSPHHPQHHNSYPSPQSASYYNHHHTMPEPQKPTLSHNPWNETGIWMHNKSPVVVPHHAYPSMHHVPIATTTTNTSTLVSPPSYQHHHHQQQHQTAVAATTNVNSQIQYQKLRDAVYSQLSEYQQKDLNDLVDLIQSLKKRELSLCLFNPVFLKQKIDEAYEALYLFQNNVQRQQQSTSMTTTPSLIHVNINNEDTNSTHSEAAAILSSLEGMTMNKKKRVFGDIFFPYVRVKWKKKKMNENIFFF